MKILDLTVKRVAGIVEERLGEPEFSGAGPDFVYLNILFFIHSFHIYSMSCMCQITGVYRDTNFSCNFEMCCIGDSSEIYFLLL